MLVACCWVVSRPTELPNRSRLLRRLLPQSEHRLEFKKHQTTSSAMFRHVPPHTITHHKGGEHGWFSHQVVDLLLRLADENDVCIRSTALAQLWACASCEQCLGPLRNFCIRSYPRFQVLCNDMRWYDFRSYSYYLLLAFLVLVFGSPRHPFVTR